MNVIELFCGSGTISKEFKKAGHKVFSIDIRKRKGICEPSLRKSILHVRIKDIPFKKVHVLWASPPCDVFSKAALGFHWNKDGTPKTKKCFEHIRILKKTIKLIEKINPDIFFIENPDGRMKYQKELVTFLIRNNAMTKKVYYGYYGFGTLKPTNIFTNALDWNPKNIPEKNNNNKMQDTSENKRGTLENNRVIFDNLTKCNRQAIPQELAEEIREYCEYKNVPGTY